MKESQHLIEVSVSESITWMQHSYDSLFTLYEVYCYSTTRCWFSSHCVIVPHKNSSLMFHWSRYCAPHNRLVPSPNTFLSSTDSMLAYIINHVHSPGSTLTPCWPQTRQSKWVQHFGTKDIVKQRPDSSTPLCSCHQQGPSST